MRIRKGSGVCIIVLSSFSVRPVQAQDRNGGLVNVGKVTDRFRKSADYGELLRILAMTVQWHSKQADEIGDTLLSIAASPSKDVHGGDLKSAAVMALASSAGGEGKDSWYPGAHARLVKITELSRGDKAATTALFWLSRLPDRARALEDVRRVAISKNPTASSAVQLLWNDFDPDGIPLLRQLYEQKLITDPTALQLATSLASADWKRPPK